MDGELVILMFALAWVFWSSAVYAAGQLRYQIEAMVDLYAPRLLASLGLVPKDLTERRNMIEALEKFIDGSKMDAFNYPLQPITDPVLSSVALHPKYKVLNIMYAPPGPGSQMNYSDAVTVGTSTGTENTFAHQFSLAYGFNLNLGIFAISRTTTRTWTDTQDSSSTFATNMVTTDSTTVPGPNDQALGVDHESDIIWLWLNPAVDYTVTSPTSFVWNGFEADPDDPNVRPGTADTIPLSVSQLDGTSPISQAEWDILDRNWDPISSGGSGPITTDDFKVILGRDPFATNLSGVGRSTAPTSSPTGNLYPIFDPNIPTVDQQNTQNPSCGNRYDLSPGFNMTFPYSQLGSINQPLTQLYALASNVAQQISSAKTDTYSVALSTKVTFPKTWLQLLNTNVVSQLDGLLPPGPLSTGGAVLMGLTATPKETLTWTDKWTQQKTTPRYRRSS